MKTLDWEIVGHLIEQHAGFKNTICHSIQIFQLDINLDCFSSPLPHGSKPASVLRPVNLISNFGILFCLRIFTKVCMQNGWTILNQIKTPEIGLVMIDK